MPRITVRYFAVLREQKGMDRETLEVDAGTTLEQLYHQLFEPRGGQRLPVGYARNQAMARGGDVLADGDEVGFIPPLGGG